eukprot:7437151-Pyramimonas_sp.AAC.1
MSRQHLRITSPKLLMPHITRGRGTSPGALLARLLPPCLIPRSSPSLGGCDLRNCRQFRGLLGGPAQWGFTAY